MITIVMMMMAMMIIYMQITRGGIAELFQSRLKGLISPTRCFLMPSIIMMIMIMMVIAMIIILMIVMIMFMKNNN